MRIDRRTLLAVVMLATACGDDADSIDLDDLDANLLDEVATDGRVISVSPGGQVLVGDGDSTCVVELDGSEGDCVDLDLDVSEPVRWSPDGRRATAANSLRAIRLVEDGDVAVIDVAAGSVSDLSADDTDDAREGPVDLFPSWVDDATVAFLRLKDGFGLDRQLQLATSGLDGEVTATDLDLDVLRLGRWTAPFGDGLLVHTLDGRRTEVMYVDPEGEMDELLDFDGSGGLISDSSADRQAVAIPTADIQVGAADPTPVAYLRIDDEAINSPFDALAATVDPAGRLVAAVTPTKAGEYAVTIWDPETEETVEVATVEPAAGITWTNDDRIVVWSFGSWQVIELT